MSDIVTRLRIPLPYNLVGMTTKQLGDERREAADEIEDLRGEIEEFKRQYQVLKTDRDRWTSCAERLVESQVEALEFYRDCQNKAREQVMRDE